MSNRLRCEQLEDRDTPAGNVTAVLYGYQLYVTGDGNDNAVSVQQDGNGNVAVIGVDGTAINGQPWVYIGRGVISDLVIRGGGGNDRIDVAGVYATGGISVETGAGNDQVSIRNVTAPYVVAYTRGGSDALTTTDVYASVAVDFQGGDGYDYWQNRNTQVGQWGSVIEFEAFV